MELKRIKTDAYARLSNGRNQVLSKDRGYGVVYLNFEGLIFALPLRSNLNHPHGFKTVFDGKVWNGVDYSKALVVNADDLEAGIFETRLPGEFKKIKENAEKIKREIFEYLTEYIEAVKGGNKLHRKFTFTTLQYFHAELKIT